MPDLHPHDSFATTLRPSTHVRARRRPARPRRAVPERRNQEHDQAALAQLHDPLASPAQVQRALTDLVAGADLRRVLRGDLAWQVPPALPPETLLQQQSGDAETGSELSTAPPADAPAAAPSLRELVLEEEAAALREALARAEADRHHEVAQLQERLCELEQHSATVGGGSGGAGGGGSGGGVRWAEIVATLLELCEGSLQQLHRSLGRDVLLHLTPDTPAQTPGGSAADGAPAPSMVQVPATAAGSTAASTTDRAAATQVAEAAAATARAARAEAAAEKALEALEAERVVRVQAETHADELRRRLRASHAAERAARMQRDCLLAEVRACEREQADTAGRAVRLEERQRRVATSWVEQWGNDAGAAAGGGGAGDGGDGWCAAGGGGAAFGSYGGDGAARAAAAQRWAAAEAEEAEERWASVLLSAGGPGAVGSPALPPPAQTQSFQNPRQQRWIYLGDDDGAAAAAAAAARADVMIGGGQAVADGAAEAARREAWLRVEEAMAAASSLLPPGGGGGGGGLSSDEGGDDEQGQGQEQGGQGCGARAQQHASGAMAAGRPPPAAAGTAQRDFLGALAALQGEMASVIGTLDADVAGSRRVPATARQQYY